MATIAERPYGPIVLACGLAVLSTPLAVAAVMLASVDAAGDPKSVPLGLAVPIAFVAVLAGGLVGGTIGALAVRRRTILGMVLAVAAAWPAALATLSITPALIGGSYAAYRTCIDSCGPALSSDRPSSAIAAYAVATVVTAAYAVPIAIVLLVVGWIAGSRGHRGAQAGLSVGAIVAINAWSMSAGLPAAVALIAGVAVWVVPYRRRLTTVSVPG
jgi:hypothetical protein